ncbi:hypothetical protein CAC42_7749 [Sphaceloma murrayae]|uniref:Uncharacterized protein n=1 Tax=Sphaceloma murrayae TaxID=2082308 RepID=A0A2K1QXK5_9PEZI|nr:hypothetical protein CAC42_7749 [Sphaceloma murrayae]
MAAIVVKAQPSPFFPQQILNSRGRPGVRPTKQADTPPPFYLTSGSGDEPSYCYTCGRVVGGRKLKNAKSSGTQSKYCSDRCKAHKPSASPSSLDRAIEDTIHLLLLDREIGEIVEGLGGVRGLSREVGIEVEDTRKRGGKGDHRVLVPCSLVETVVFGRQSNVSRGQGRRRRARDAKVEEKGKNDVDYDEEKLLATLGRLRVAEKKAGGVEDEDSGTEGDSDEGGGGETAGTDVTQESLDEKRREGQRRAEERERVRNACRRAVIFGLREPGSAGAAAGEDFKGHKKGLSNGSITKPTDDWSSDDDTRKGKKGKRGKGSKSTNGETDAKKDRGYVMVDGERRRLCEAYMRGEIVEPSFAKGEWAVRWREEQ